MNQQQKNIVENYIKAYNDFDVDGMTKHLSNAIVFENISNGKVGLRTEGLVAFKKMDRRTYQGGINTPVCTQAQILLPCNRN